MVICTTNNLALMTCQRGVTAAALDSKPSSLTGVWVQVPPLAPISYSSLRKVMSIQVWKVGEAGEPKFPDNFEVVKKAVLQVTDITTNRNKYYAVELHSAKSKFRVFTHYGRTDDLDSNPNAGVRESRYCNDLVDAETLYDKIFKEKTSARKGYKEVHLASSKIGSHKSVGKSSGHVDDKTLKKLADKSGVIKIPTITIAPPVQDLVNYLYGEATKTLTKTVNATITANGIETPLGVLTIGQIDKGQAVLDELADALEKKKKSTVELTKLSGEFYTHIPHKFGRSKEAALEAVINSAQKINDKQDTLQLMRDMLNVNGKTNVLVNPEIEKRYQALSCEIKSIDKGDAQFKKIRDYVIKSQTYKGGIKVNNIYTLRRENEQKEFSTKVGNCKLLFHGSAAWNWLGILSRGLLLPKKVVTLGVHRTDQGWLGHGIYFGDAVDTALNYAHSGKRGTSFVALATVALGKMKKYHDITYGLKSPPSGYDSCHGVRGTEFDDDEFVIYDQNQQKLEYLVEIDS